MQRIFAGLGWGVLIYSVMYLAWSGLVIYGLSTGISSLAIRIALLFVLATIAVRALRLSRMHDILPIALGWAVIAAAADSIFLVPFTGWSLYSSWNVWAGYLLIVIAPLLSVALLSRTRTSTLTP